MAEESKRGEIEKTKTEDAFERDLKNLIAKNESYRSYLDILGPELSSAAETIEKTKLRLLKEADTNPGLHLLLYAVDGSKDNLPSWTNQKMLPWWSNVLHRLAIAQQIIDANVKKENLTFEQVKDMFPREDETTLKHILTALLYSVTIDKNNELEEKYEIIKALTTEPEKYERIKQWGLEKRTYIYKCIAGFINCTMSIQKRNATPKSYIRVAVEGDLYGYFKTGEDLIGLNSYDRLLSERESMKWFAQEVANALMFDFEWDQAIQWSTYVYKTLTYTK